MSNEKLAVSQTRMIRKMLHCGVTQKVLAKKFGVSTSTVSRINMCTCKKARV